MIDQFSALIHTAAKISGVRIGYEYKDKQFTASFKATRTVTHKSGRQSARELRYTVVPDWLFSFKAGQDDSGNHIPTRNLFVECQRSNRMTKSASSLDAKSLKKKLEGYYYYYKQQKWLERQGSKLQLECPNNMRVLFVTDMKRQEHENFIQLARSVDERGLGIRLFWILRIQELAENPLSKILQPIWQTPVEGDELKCLLFSR